MSTTRRVILTGFLHPKAHEQRSRFFAAASSYGVVETLQIFSSEGKNSILIQFQRTTSAKRFIADLVEEHQKSGESFSPQQATVQYSPPHEDLCSEGLLIWGKYLPLQVSELRKKIRTLDKDLKSGESISVHVVHDSFQGTHNNQLREIIRPVLGTPDNSVYFGHIRTKSIAKASALLQAFQRNWAISFSDHQLASYKDPVGMMFIDNYVDFSARCDWTLSLLRESDLHVGLITRGYEASPELYQQHLLREQQRTSTLPRLIDIGLHRKAENLSEVSYPLDSLRVECVRIKHDLKNPFSKNYKRPVKQSHNEIVFIEITAVEPELSGKIVTETKYKEYMTVSHALVPVSTESSRSERSGGMKRMRKMDQEKDAVRKPLHSRYQLNETVSARVESYGVHDMELVPLQGEHGSESDLSARIRVHRKDIVSCSEETEYYDDDDHRSANKHGARHISPHWRSLHPIGSILSVRILAHFEDDKYFASMSQEVQQSLLQRERAMILPLSRVLTKGEIVVGIIIGTLHLYRDLLVYVGTGYKIAAPARMSIASVREVFPQVQNLSSILPVGQRVVVEIDKYDGGHVERVNFVSLHLETSSLLEMSQVSASISKDYIPKELLAYEERASLMDNTIEKDSSKEIASFDKGVKSTDLSEREEELRDILECLDAISDVDSVENDTHELSKGLF